MTAYGVRIAGVGSAVPENVLHNTDLEQMMDTSHDWIVQRTGIHRRHIIKANSETQLSLATDGLTRALANANMEGRELDLIINATVTSEMTCPSNACRIAAQLGAVPTAGFDLQAACSGFVYAINLADSLIRCGRHRAIGVVGCDALSNVSDFTERTVSILFGDGGGAAVLTRDDDPNRGCQFQELGADGSRWDTLYMPRRPEDVPEWDSENKIRFGCLRMTGREVFKFAVSKFREVIQRAMSETNLTPDDISQFVCHQSNLRIIDSAIEKLGLPPEKVHVNIDEYGNTSAGSVPIVLNELWQAGKIKTGDKIVMVAFGGGLTWASNVWQV